MPNRILRDWTLSESMDSLTVEAELFFTRLIMKADDYGSYYGNPKMIKGALFPLKTYTEDQVKAWRDECVRAGIITLYTVQQKEYIKILDFGQRLRAMVSKFPPLPDGCQSSVSNPPSIVDHSAAEEKRREEKPKGKGMTLVDFKKLLSDEIWTEQMKMIHKGKNLEQAINESYGWLIANPERLAATDSKAAKQLVSSWLSKMQKDANGKIAVNPGKLA